MFIHMQQWVYQGWISIIKELPSVLILLFADQRLMIASVLFLQIRLMFMWDVGKLYIPGLNILDKCVGHMYTLA